ncbi:MAG TPA: response regulator [Candidatus Binatia bacterium]|nr:response regulator [Candidatus Binatia bacterium]
MTKELTRPVTVLMADDDEDDRMLARDAFAECAGALDLRCVEDGEDLMDYLRQRGPYTDAGAAPAPALILLDLNMPRKDGREALAEIKSDPVLRSIPVIVLTTSKAEEDVMRSYDLGVSSFISKPVTYEALVRLVETLSHYWFETVELPGHRQGKPK